MNKVSRILGPLREMKLRQREILEEIDPQKLGRVAEKDAEAAQ